MIADTIRYLTIGLEHDIAGKNAIITGASRKAGIGAAIARALAQAGANVFITTYPAYDALMPWGNHPNDATELLDELRTLGIQADGLELDLSHPDAARTLFDQAAARLGKIHILVNNAAYSTLCTIDELTAPSTYTRPPLRSQRAGYGAAVR